MGKLSTHVLDTMHGRPAQALRIELFAIENGARRLLKHVDTNADGRSDGPLLEQNSFHKGVYELVFHAGDYFARLGIELAEPRFLDQVSIRFGVSDNNENYHVPLLVT